MDFDTKLSLFKKRALWKQIEGYKAEVSQKEEEYRKCELDKIEAERVSKTINLILMKIRNSFSNEHCIQDDINDSLKPLKEFLLNNNIGNEISQNILYILGILSKKISENHDKINFLAIESSSEIQKDLYISELESKLDSQIEKSNVLSNKVYSLEKQISVLKAIKSIDNSDSPSKRPRTDQSKNELIDVSDSVNQEFSTKFKIVSVELDELRKISVMHAKELRLLQSDNKKLLEELESKKDQLSRIPQELLKDGASFRQMNDDLRRYKSDLNDAISTIKGLEKEIDDSNHRNKKIISQLERDLKEKYTKLDDFVKSTDSEICRLRKDRDSMRQMYEQTNSLLSSCQKQLSSYQKNVNCSEVAIHELTETVGKLKSHVQLIPNLINGTFEFTTAIETLRADEQLYVEELENLGKAFEQLQSENSSLIKRIADRDDQISKLLGDKLKAEFSFPQIQKEAESSLERANKIEEIAKHRIKEAETREDMLRRQVASMDKGLSEQIVAINNYKSRLSEASAENTYLRGKVDKYIAEITELQNQIPAPGHKDQLAFEKRRLSEELSIANKKLEAYAESGVGLVKELEEELGNYKKLMKCNSCHIRDKNAVILKCMHCFCKNCLDTRLETRQRKCPNCGDAFATNELDFCPDPWPSGVSISGMSHLFAPNKRNIEFHELFKNISHDELLIDSYSCALSREILIHGRLYLSANYACFNANILGWVTNIVVNLKDIVSVEKKMTALIIPNGITLSTLHTRHVYASFLKRDEAYNKICRIWKNCIADKPIPTTELLSQIASGSINADYDDQILNQKRFRERKTSAITDNGIESIMSDDFSMSGDLDPALTVRREYNFGTSRAKLITFKSFEAIDEQKTENNGEISSKDHEYDNFIETEEEQKEIRESILPCACAFHYKIMLVDQLILVPLPQIIERLLFSPKTSLTSVPRAFQRTLKELGAKEVNFSPWKIYLGKWERRVWNCEIPARKLLLHDTYLSVKVTDSIITRQNSKLCVESLMQIDGIPGGGSFVKWKLCATAPKAESPSLEQCRITITAAAAAPLGSWFKESIRTALLQHAEEIWIKAIENSANFDQTEDFLIDSKSDSLNGTMVKSSESISKLISPQNLHNSLNTVTLTYFDRKAFFLSISRLVSAILILFLAVVMGNIFINRQSASIIPDIGFEKENINLNRFIDAIQKDYYIYIENNLQLHQNYPEILEQASGEFNILDSQLTEIIGQVYRIQREMGDQIF